MVFLKFSDNMSLLVLLLQVCLDKISSLVEISKLKKKDEIVIPVKSYENRGQSDHGMRTRKTCKDYVDYVQRLKQKCVKRQESVSLVSRSRLLKKQNTKTYTRVSINYCVFR